MSIIGISVVILSKSFLYSNSFFLSTAPFGFEIILSNCGISCSLYHVEGFEPRRVRLIRHPLSAKAAYGIDISYYDLWRTDNKKFDYVNSEQQVDKFGDSDYLAVFVGTPNDETLFVKFYKINNQYKLKKNSC